LSSTHTDIDNPKEHELLYQYTSGRWLYDESLQLLQHYRKFNIAGLKQVVSEAASGAKVTGIEKIAEGGFNKVLRAFLENGSTVIARIPMPLVEAPQLVVASEVATMKLLREIYDFPVPRVLSYGSNPSQTPVDAEYIIMEDASMEGIELGKIWEDLTTLQKDCVVKSWITLEKRLADAAISGGYGNIYLKQDVESIKTLPLLVNGTHSQFVIGPSVERSFWRDEKKLLKIDRGPCKSACCLWCNGTNCVI
jgi:hypothetical protein